MFKVIDKRSFFEAMDGGHAPEKPMPKRLKSIQDCVALSLLRAIRPKVVGEIGADQSRILPKLGEFATERYAIDVYDQSIGGGTTRLPDFSEIRHLNCLVGASREVIPDDFFDCTFSISVVEHVTRLEAFYDDIVRITKAGGVSLHLIDLYLDDTGINFQSAMVEKTLGFLADPRIAPLEPPEIVRADDLRFSCSHASNDDFTMYTWNRTSPALAAVRPNCQVVSLLLGFKVR